MTMRVNAGYTITNSVRIGNTEFVVGENPKAPSPYVTWECTGGNNYYWGHYMTDKPSAVRDMFDRASQELDFLKHQQTQHLDRTPKKEDRGR